MKHAIKHYQAQAISGLGILLVAASATAAPVQELIVTANPAVINEGEAASINWGSTNTEFCQINGREAGTQPTEGNWRSQPLTQSKRFTVACYGGTTSVSKSVDVTVKPKAPTMTFSVNPMQIKAGEKVTRYWSSENTTACQSKTGTPLSTSGVWVTEPVYSSNTYQITCMGPGGSVTKSADVTVVP
jgi:plastocyanin